MESYLVHGGIGLGRGSLARIDDGRGMLVHLWDGEVHITQEGDPRDHFVRAGLYARHSLPTSAAL